MAVLAQIKEEQEEIINLASRYGVNNIRIFGFVARQEERNNSDLDLLIACKEDCSLFDIIELKKNELENMFE